MSKKENHLVEKFQKQKQEFIEQQNSSAAEEKKEAKAELEADLKQWEDQKQERLKKFLTMRETHNAKVAAEEKDDGNQRRRARTLASSSPVSHFFQPLQPQIVRTNRIQPSTVDTISRPVPHVPLPQAKKLTPEDIFDQGGKVRTSVLKDHFLQEGKITKEAALAILDKASQVLKQEPNLLDLNAPITVVGDVHGQYFDVCHLIDCAGDPSHTPYLFLGDYVDRGTYGCEVCFLLLSYKINHPFTFFMMRGNHESRLLTTHFNFKHECIYKYGVEVYAALMTTFDCLPIAALVKNQQGNFFCTHGGLSPDINQLEDIDEIDRFMEPPERGPLCDLLWSDPIEERTALGLTEEEMEEWFELDYLPNPTRGCGYIFGYAAVVPFLQANNLLTVIRAHEVQKEGYYCHYFWKNDLDFPVVVTLFSAPNYCDMYANQAGFIRFTENDFNFHQVGWVEHPYCLPNFLNAITYSVPYALEAFTRLCAYILEGILQGANDEDIDDELRQKVNAYGKMSVFIHKIREQREEIIAGTVNFGEQVEKFEKALQLDCKNEKRPRRTGARRRTKTL